MEPKDRQRKLVVIAPASTHLDRWRRLFQESGWDVEWIAYAWPHPDAIAFVPELNSRFPGVTAWRLLRESVRLRRLLRTIDPDVIHAFWITGPAWLAAVSRTCPLVVTALGSDALIFARQTRLGVLMTWVLGRRAAAVTYDSNSIAVALERLRVPRAKLHRLVFGVDPNRFKPELRDQRMLRSFGINNSDPVILSPRGTREVYEPGTILRGFSKALETHPCNLLIRVSDVHVPQDSAAAVDEADWNQLRALADALGITNRVFPYAAVPESDLPVLVASSDIVVSVPKSDGTSVSLLEALFCEVPVVVSDLPANREWIPDGRFGKIVPIGDADGLSKALLAILSDPPSGRSAAHLAAIRTRENGNEKVEFGRARDLYEEIATGG